MKLFHHITASVFLEQEEDEKTVAEKLSIFLPEDFVEQGITMELDEAHIEEGRNITILSIQVEKERHTKFFFEVFKEMLGDEQIETLISQENRVDEKGKFYVRFDKQKFLENDEVELVDHGNCIHFTFMIAAYPKNRNRALEIVKNMFDTD